MLFVPAPLGNDAPVIGLNVLGAFHAYCCKFRPGMRIRIDEVILFAKDAKGLPALVHAQFMSFYKFASIFHMAYRNIP